VRRRPDRLLAVAHRSGNSVAGLRAALDAGVDLVECDVHLHRAALEVRHHKTLGPAHLWDKWELVRRADMELAQLSDLMTQLRDDPRLMVDLKGIDRALAGRVARVLREHDPAAPFTVCTKHWWMLDAFDEPVRRVLSASNRPALLRLRRRLRREPAHGVSVRLALLTPAVVRELRGATDVVMTWPVDTPAALDRARQVGVDAVISKELDVLRAAVRPR